MTILVARKRLGVRTECNGQIRVAFTGCVPVPNVPVRALGILTFKGAQPLTATSRRTPHAVGAMSRLLGTKAMRYVGEAAQRALTCGTRANGLSTMKRLAHDTGTRKMNRSGN